VLKNDLPRSRICFTFSRNFGNAAQRNRAKRLGREAYRNLKPSLQSGYDLILLAYPDDVKPGKQRLDERAGQLRYLCAKAGLLK
jgi:ribonuclease P protein component